MLKPNYPKNNKEKEVKWIITIKIDLIATINKEIIRY